MNEFENKDLLVLAGAYLILYVVAILTRVNFIILLGSFLIGWALAASKSK